MADFQDRDANRQAEKRAATRDIIIPDVADPARRTELEADDREWLRFYLPTIFTDDFAEDQTRMLRAVGQSLRYGTEQAMAARRAGGKTSITKGMVLKNMLTRECPFTVYIGASDGKADQANQSIRHHLTHGCRDKGKQYIPVTTLGQDYPFECSVASYVSKHSSRCQNVTTHGGWRIHVQWSGDYWIMPSIEAGEADAKECWSRWMIRPGEIGAILLPCGITSSLLQGVNVLDMRPRQVILDDLDKRDSLAADRKRSVTEIGQVSQKIEEIVDKTISGMRTPGHQMGQVMLCTVTARVSVAFRYTDPEIKPTWRGMRMPLMIKKPLREDLWDEYITLWQTGVKEKDEAGNPVDEFARKAHQFYLDHFDEMNEGAELATYNLHDDKLLPDGSRLEVYSLQWVYNFIAKFGEEAFNTEYQQEPPADDRVDRLILTGYHVQHNARSGMDRGVVPQETAGIVCGMDIKKLGFHFVVAAYSGTPTLAVVIDYGFHETKFSGDKLELKDAERAILNGLHEWKQERDENPYKNLDGEEFKINLSLIDRGWKDESWAGQPVDHFCAEAGLDRFFPCKGSGDAQYRQPSESRRIVVGDNCHVSFLNAVPYVDWNSDHWKLKVHEGFLTPPGQPGSLSLFNPAKTVSRRTQPHLSYSKHIIAEVWEERFMPGYRGMVCRWWKDGSQNHYLDATAQALVARSILGATTLEPPKQSPQSTAPAPVPIGLGVSISYHDPAGRSW